MVAGAVINAKYRLFWGIDAPPSGDVGRIVATRIGLGGLGGHVDKMDMANAFR